MGRWLVIYEPYHDNGGPVRWFETHAEADAFIAEHPAPQWLAHETDAEWSLYELLDDGTLRYQRGPLGEWFSDRLTNPETK